MNKCTECHSCLRSTMVGNNIYFFCTLCRKIYRLLAGGKLEEIIDDNLKEEILNTLGRRI